jgi:hypothetical protein
MLADLLKEYADSRSATAIRQYIEQGGAASFIPIADFAAKDALRALKDAGIVNQPCRFKDTGALVIAVRGCDAEKAVGLFEEVFAEQQRMPRITLEAFSGLHGKKPSYCIEGLQEHQVFLLQEVAKKTNFVFATHKDDDGKYKVYVKEDDIQKANSALIDVAIASAGIRGEYARDGYNHTQNVVNEANALSHKPDRDFYVVCGSNPAKYSEYIHVTPEGYEYFRNDNLIKSTNQKESLNFESEINIRFNNIIDPVILTPEEFSTGEPARSQIISSKVFRAELNEEQAYKYDIETEVIGALKEQFKTTNEASLNVESILENFETEEERDVAKAFLSSMIKYKTEDFSIDFVGDTKEALSEYVVSDISDLFNPFENNKDVVRVTETVLE